MLFKSLGKSDIMEIKKEDNSEKLKKRLRAKCNFTWEDAWRKCFCKKDEVVKPTDPDYIFGFKSAMQRTISESN